MSNLGGQNDKTRKVVIDGVEVGEIESTGNTLEDVKRADALARKLGAVSDKPVHPALAIFRQALGFSQASKLIHDTHLRREPFNAYAVAPFVVNSVFALELFLKALHRLAAKDARGHDLGKLYEALPEETRGSIEERAVALAAKRPHEKLRGVYAMLDHLSKAFEHWRYVYEGRTLHVEMPALVFLLVLLQEACKQQLGQVGAIQHRPRAPTDRTA